MYGDRDKPDNGGRIGLTPLVQGCYVCASRVGLECWSGRNPVRGGTTTMSENEHPKGALLFIAVYLLLLAALWTNAYLRLWGG